MSSVLQVENINVYYGSIHAVKDVSFHVEQGEVVTLIGANGAGKSTARNTVAGRLRSRTGSVHFLGEELRHVPGHKLVGRGMALVPEGRRIFQHMTVQENLDMGGYCRGGDKSADMERVFDRFPRLKERRRRVAGTLSGGESQRIRLTTQIGSALSGVLYVLDEPSIGLHQRDNDRLLETLKHLRDLGNTLIVVEHDEDTMYAADYIVDVGPGAGIHGGEIVCAGTVDEIKACKRSLTGQYLSGARFIPIPEKRRQGNGKFLKVVGAKENNLKGIDVTIPLGEFVCVTGVSGSGKSSLVNEILYKRLANELNGAKRTIGAHQDMVGIQHLDKVIDIDQSPIGRTPRSNPATYTGVFTDIRELFASTQESKMRGFKSNRFSFNVKGGRCEACQGDGIVKIEMHFLADIYVPCEVCKGARYNRETLEVKYKGKNIYDVLEMTVEEGLEFFSAVPKIQRKLQTLYDVGLGYIKIGQPATTLSGGEAQRVKLSTELSRRATGRTIYILDEPTTGLHTADVHRLIEVLHTLVENGNSVLVIEHNLDVIKTADHIIDLGPEGGDKGGMIVAEGTPEEVARVEASYTGRYLKRILERG